MSSFEVAFTGPSHLSAYQAATARRVLRGLQSPSSLVTWRSGGAYGLDTLVVEEAGPNVDVCMFVPVGYRYNTSLLTAFDVADTVYVEGGYRARNEALVKDADILHAFLWRDTFYRSGEWMTVNIARRAGIPVDIHLLP